MRTKTLLLTAALSAAGVASSMAQGTVFSVNAVGYVNTTVKSKVFALVANPLIASDNSIGALFKDLPFGTTVSKYNPTTSKFDTATHDDIEVKYIPAANAALTVNPGEGVFVKNGGNADATVTFVGEVPQGSLKNDFPKGLSIRASQVPQDGKVTTDLGFPAKPGDVISKFDVTTQRFASYTFDDLLTPPAWTLAGVANEPTFAVGEAFFLKAANAGSWTRTFSVNN
jgi:hypothetical protein